MYNRMQFGLNTELSQSLFRVGCAVIMKQYKFKSRSACPTSSLGVNSTAILADLHGLV